MSAHEQMRAMLDQLMGTSRNGEVGGARYKFTDARVCKSFLLACCPHEILTSTRMDLGECPKIHDLALRADYDNAAKTKDYFYDIDALEHLKEFIADCDRRTELAKRRLAETQEELSAEVAAKANNVHELAEQIGQKLAKAEQLGAEGHVEESMQLMEEVEEIRKRKATAEQEYRNSMPASSYQQQKLRVCEVCSAYLGIHDNDRRLADHFGGKLHLGFIKIREKLAELEKTVEERRVKRREELDKREREEEERRQRRSDVMGTDRDRDRYRRDRDRDDRYRHDRDRDRHSDRRDRHRDYDRDHHRNRSRDDDHRSRRSRDDDREHRSSSRSHRHSRDRHSRSRTDRSDRSRSRSRSRSEKHRSRSRDRHRSPSTEKPPGDADYGKEEKTSAEQPEEQEKRVRRDSEELEEGETSA